MPARIIEKCTPVLPYRAVWPHVPGIETDRGSWLLIFSTSQPVSTVTLHDAQEKWLDTVGPVGLISVDH